jgi:putative restriction endonuclease
MARFFGTPDGVHVGQLFETRADLQAAHVHAPGIAGISGTAAEGADSIVMSGGYTDDEDHGDYIIYTGHGGNNPSTKKQVADQSIDTPGNAGLISSETWGLPVRVTRGSKLQSKYAPPVGYIYAGLYSVSSHWTKTGADGFLVVQFRLDRIPEQADLITSVAPDPDPAFAKATVSRRVRDTPLSRALKKLYKHQCQVCGLAIEGSEGRLYSEGAHVRPLGRPHLGADKLENLLNLCPNHHSQLDIGGLFILKDMSLSDVSGATVGSLSFAKGHELDFENAAYHRSMWFTAFAELPLGPKLK